LCSLCSIHVQAPISKAVSDAQVQEPSVAVDHSISDAGRSAIMTATSEYEIAHSMLRLWGRDAAIVAAGYTIGLESADRPMEAARWQQVTSIVAGFLKLMEIHREETLRVGTLGHSVSELLSEY
jgi:hypothetical protein